MKCPLKLIEWHDAYNGNHDWCKLSDTVDTSLVVVQTLGFEVHRTDTQVTLAMSSASNGLLCDLFTIPLAVVVREQTLRSRLR